MLPDHEPCPCGQLRDVEGGIVFDVERPASTDLQKYLAVLLSSGRSNSTAQRRRACYRQFYRYMRMEGEIDHDPTRNLPIPKGWKKIRTFLTTDEVERMADLVVNEKNFASWHLDPSDVRRELRRRAAATLAELVDVLFRMEIAPSGKPRWGDKTPMYYLC